MLPEVTSVAEVHRRKADCRSRSTAMLESHGTFEFSLTTSSEPGNQGIFCPAHGASLALSHRFHGLDLSVTTGLNVGMGHRTHSGMMIAQGRY
jgi:hypothetical protein